ncbi:hypothetical protein ACFLZX_00165 [Nanoarchaeota archaeon]
MSKKRLLRKNSQTKKYLTPLYAMFAIVGALGLLLTAAIINQQNDFDDNLVGQAFGRRIGEITADPCIGNPTCVTTVRWNWNRIGRYHAKVMVGDQVVSCTKERSGSGEVETWDIIDPTILTLYIATNCEPGNSGRRIFLDNVEIVRQDPQPITPTCSLPSELGGGPMVEVSEDFLGIEVNWLKMIPESYYSVLNKLVDANVKVLRFDINQVKLTAYGDTDTRPPDFPNWDHYDNFFDTIKRVENERDHDFKIRASLLRTPKWASSDPCVRNPTGEQCANSPPAQDNPPTERWVFYYPESDEYWLEVVEGMVTRYGYAVDVWEMNSEPGMSWRGPNDYRGYNVERMDPLSPVNYKDRLNILYDTVKELDPTAEVVAPEVIIALAIDEAYAHLMPYWHFTNFGEPFLDEVLDDGNFDAITVHNFGLTEEDIVDAFQMVKEKVSSHPNGGSIPIHVSSAQIGAEINGTLWHHCPYWNSSEEEHARILNDVYVCLANVGAKHVSTYKGLDRAADYCPDGFEHSGIMTHQEDGHREKAAYFAVKEISEYIESINS